MSIRKRKIKYDCVRYGSFNISFRAYVHILSINTLLWIKRQARRIARGFQYSRISLIVLPAWALFIAFVYYWGGKRGDSSSIGDIVWELKAGIYSSVVIAAITSLVSQYYSNRDNFIIQHKNYIEMMYIFSEFYDSLLEISGRKRTGIKPPFNPFYYSEDMLKTTKEVFPKTLQLQIRSAETEKVQRLLKRTKEIIGKLANDAIVGKLDGCTFSDYSFAESNCLTFLDQIEDLLSCEQEIYNWDVVASHCIVQLYDLLELVRKPWRRDLKYKLDVLKTIYEQDPSVACTYYIKTLLGVVD